MPFQLQIISDLHLETPLSSPAYTTFQLEVQASNLLLLGDIGLVKDEGLFEFLRTTLEQCMGCRIFYVTGNHEAYQLPYVTAIQRMRDFEAEAKDNYGGRFIFLDRDRYDLDGSTTILGCTLWSAISAQQASEAQLRLTDFNKERGIYGWTMEDHIRRHQQDLEWLNAQLQELEQKEPHRQVAVVTHHSPTMDPRAINPQHQGSRLSSCFATDLSEELCWNSSMVKLWAFGHTHYNCAFRDESTGKLVSANQKGYERLGARGSRRLKSLLIDTDGAEWKIVQVAKEKRVEDGTDCGEGQNSTVDDDVIIVSRICKRWKVFAKISRRMHGRSLVR
ncbi:uncharacterized protein CC84DRAFT_1186497 [Paraphaeosphaeria sporulosa]|uniref:Calcineurin-like phosphoesterase domain-containing protein n=1 Tax=Paraphaeosphaeria sporulosa TaxID=1460663 RepID=A0A177CK15_9PLEO|nr:uncharacterized protein CC84DRAFT_1186497 [Paraphaeosphaeria sporulosa]OAG07591.1 hypothetical protein CC84DRAFT_1186497 [Paraphaeosphaeria sporulosa]